MPNIEQELQLARQSLLDLTMRNRLLNYRPSRARTIKIIDEIPREVYDILVLQGKQMDFLPKYKKDGLDNDEIESGNNEDLSLTKQEASQLWTSVFAKKKAEDRHIDNSLQTSLDPEVLQRRLFYIHQQADTVFEEQGYTVLYLALGILEWTESDVAGQTRLAPLILVPVELTRLRAKSAFKVKWTEDEVSTNISLKEKLAEQGITLPDFEMPESKSNIDAYFESVNKAVSRKERWRVLTDIYLGFFSFTKFVMYKDLDSQSWPEDKLPADSLLIKALIDPNSIERTDIQSFNEEEVDKKIKTHNVYHVMDADPSQIAVIEDVKTGQNLVVEGPPGTGKSQTITNTIAELLAVC